MGNAGYIEVVHRSRFGDGAKSVYLYSHWEGCFLAEFVRTTLAWSRARWWDAEYLTRFLVLDITEGSEKNELNLSISLETFPVPHRRVVVDVPEQRVRFLCAITGNCSGDWSFDEYVALSRDELDRAFHRDYGDFLNEEGREALEWRLARISPPWDMEGGIEPLGWSPEGNPLWSPADAESPRAFRPPRRTRRSAAKKPKSESAVAQKTRSERRSRQLH